jgi:hypothetical protein
MNCMYQAWTAKSVEDRILEAAETELALPRLKGPKVYGSAMPTPVQDRQDAYGYHSTKVRRIPAPGALDRYPVVIDWLNHHIDSVLDRQFLWFWAIAKANPNRSVGKYAHDNGVNLRTLRRLVTRLCQQIANGLNNIYEVRLTMAFDGVSEIPHEADPEQVASVKYASFHREPDAKPFRDISPEELAAAAKAIERSNKQARKTQAAQKRKVAA